MNKTDTVTKRKVDIPQMSAKVAIIIPCYNYGEYVEEAVHSALASTYENIEIIIVDDGSTEQETIQVLKEIKMKPKTRVVRRENGGLSAARNTGIRHTDAEYVLLLDADDLIEPTFIEKGLWLLEKYNIYSYAYPLVQLFGETNGVWNTLPFNFFYLKFRNYIPATIILRRTVWEITGGYDETMRDGYEDWEFLLRIGKHGFFGVHINQILFYYRKHHGSMLGDSNTKRKYLLEQIYTRHPDLYRFKDFQYALFVFKEVVRRSKKFISDVRTGMVKKIAPKLKEQIKRVVYPPLIEARESPITINQEKDFLPVRQAKDKKRILICLPWLQFGGVERVFLNIIKALCKDYDFIVVTTLSSLRHPWEELFVPYVQAVYHIGDFLTDERDKLQFLCNIISSWDIDIIHLSNTQFGYRILPYLKKRFSSITVIDTLHMEEPWAAWDYFRLSQKFQEFIDYRVTLTVSQKEQLQQLGERADKITVIPNGIDLIDKIDVATKMKRRNKFVVSFIGRFVEQKQPLVFLQVAKICKDQKVPIQFEMYGEGELRRKVKDLIHSWDLSNVSLHPFAPDVYKVLKDTDVLCAPSLREGLPMVGLEAMNAGVPIVATRVPGWNDLITDDVTGLLCELNPQLIASKCILLYENNLKYVQIAELAREQIVNCYTQERMSGAYADLYRN